jgi:hypothetical protein
MKLTTGAISVEVSWSLNAGIFCGTSPAAYVTLASDEASYISGATVAVTGGAPII